MLCRKHETKKGPEHVAQVIIQPFTNSLYYK